MRGFLKAWLFIVLASLTGLLPTSAKAQGWAIQGQAVDQGGHPLKFALVRVCLYTASGSPCSPLTSLWSDIPQTHSIANPYTTDSLGNYTFVVNPANSYVIQIFSGSTLVFSYLYTAGVPAAGGSVTTFSAGNLSPLFTTNVTNPTTAPHLGFTLSNTADSTLFGNFSGSSGAPSFWTLAAGANITITPSGSTVTISSSGSGSVTPSPKFQIPFYSAAGTASILTGDPNILTDGNGNLSSKSWAGTGTNNGAWYEGYTGISAAAPAAHQVQFTQTVDPGSGYSLGGYPAALPSLNDSSPSYSTAGVPEWISLHAPPAIGDKTFALSVESNLLRSDVGCDVTSNAPCWTNQRQGLNCTVNQPNWYGCNWESNVWTNPLLGSSTGAAGVDSYVNSYTYGPGIDTGNCSNCGSAIWSGWRNRVATYNLNRRSLDGISSESVNLNKAGDFLGRETTINGIGGVHASSDEGVDAVARARVLEPAFWTATMPGSIASQTVIYPSTPASSNGAATIDFSWLLDVSQQVTGGAFNGGGSSAGNGFLHSYPVTGLTLAASNWDTCTPGIGQATGLPRPTVTSYTVTCTVQLGTGITTGWAKVGANFGEGVTVTAATAPSAGSQTVTFTANQPQPSGFTMWQNPGSGTSYTGYCGWANDDFTYTGQKPLFQVFGALDSTHLVIGIQGAGTLSTPEFPNTGNSYESTTSAFTIAPCAEVVQNIATQFTGTLTAGSTVVTGVSDTTNIGPGQLIFGPGLLADPLHLYSVVSVSGSTVNINGNAHQSGTVQLSTVGGIQLEPHAWTIAANDNLEDPHSANPSLEGGVWGDVEWQTPNHGGSGQAFFLAGCGGHYCGEGFHPFRALSNLTVDQYHDSFQPIAMAYSAGSNGTAKAGYFGGGFGMDFAPLPASVDSNFHGIINAAGSTFPVTDTTNGSTTLAVSGMPNPSVMCPQVLGQLITGQDIPSNTTISACTAGSTNTATITLSNSASGSHSNIAASISYRTTLYDVGNDNSGFLASEEVDPTAGIIGFNQTVGFGKANATTPYWVHPILLGDITSQYMGISLSNSLSDNARAGLIQDYTGSDKTLYEDALPGGEFRFRIGCCGGGTTAGDLLATGWKLPSGTVYSFNGDTAISRDSIPGVMDVGGIAGDTTGGTNQLKHFSPASFVARNQTSATTTHTLLTTTATALYRINYSAACTGGAGSTITLTVGWTDPNSHAQTQSFSGLDCATNLNAGNSLPVNALTGTDITIAVSIASSPTYDVAATVEQLTSN